MRKNRFLYALALSPLLLGAGGQVSSPLTINSALPVCSDGQFLTYSGGSLQCTTITGSSGLSLRDCNTGGQLLTGQKNGDIATLGCTNKGSSGIAAADQTRINNIKDALTLLGTDITNLQASPPPASPLFVGITMKAKTTGRMEHGGANPGLEAAAAYCGDEYGAGAHMCTPWEIYASIRAGKFKYDGTGNIPKSWIFAPAENAPGSSIAAPMNPLEGYADTCAGQLYGTHDLGWTGVAFEWTVIRTNNYGPKFHNGKNVDCFSNLPIACCK